MPWPSGKAGDTGLHISLLFQSKTYGKLKHDEHASISLGLQSLLRCRSSACESWHCTASGMP